MDIRIPMHLFTYGLHIFFSFEQLEKCMTLFFWDFPGPGSFKKHPGVSRRHGNPGCIALGQMAVTAVTDTSVRVAVHLEVRGSVERPATDGAHVRLVVAV